MRATLLIPPPALPAQKFHFHGHYALGRLRLISNRGKQLLTKVRSFIVTVLSRRLNIRLVLLQPLRHQLISQTKQIPTCI